MWKSWRRELKGLAWTCRPFPRRWVDHAGLLCEISQQTNLRTARSPVKLICEVCVLVSFIQGWRRWEAEEEEGTIWNSHRSCCRRRRHRGTKVPQIHLIPCKHQWAGCEVCGLARVVLSYPSERSVFTASIRTLGTTWKPFPSFPVFTLQAKKRKRAERFGNV